MLQKTSKTKICNCCGELKVIERDFYLQRGKREGQCKLCVREKRRLRRVNPNRHCYTCGKDKPKAQFSHAQTPICDKCATGKVKPSPKATDGCPWPATTNPLLDPLRR